MRLPGDVRRGSLRRGFVALGVAICLIVLCGFVALVVDLGNLYRVRNELQNSVDAAALAAAIELDSQLEGLERARARVLEYAEAHLADGATLQVEPADILFGHWHYAANAGCAPAPCFQSYGTDPSADEALRANAVRVIGRRGESTGNPVSLFFAPLLGLREADVDAFATAVGGGPSMECGFPMVVPDCALGNAVPGGSGELCDFCMRLQDANSDNAGWTTFQAHGGVDGPGIASLIRQMCYVNPDDQDSAIAIDADGECTGGCSDAAAGDEVQVGNGNGMNTSKQNFCPTIQRLLTRGVDGGPAAPFTVRVPVMDSGLSAADCNPGFSSTQAIDGFATLVFYGARCSNKDTEVRVSTLPMECSVKPNWPPPSGKYIIAALECDLASNQFAGGGFYGTDARRVRLVE